MGAKNKLPSPLFKKHTSHESCCMVEWPQQERLDIMGIRKENINKYFLNRADNKVLTIDELFAIYIKELSTSIIDEPEFPTFEIYLKERIKRNSNVEIITKKRLFQSVNSELPAGTQVTELQMCDRYLKLRIANGGNIPDKYDEYIEDLISSGAFVVAASYIID
jgi:hypothetical protein